MGRVASSRRAPSLQKGEAIMGRKLSWWALVALTTLAPACQCGSQPPPKAILHPEGDPCTDDEQCETGLCEKTRGGPSKCVRKCTAGCRALEVCAELAPQRYGRAPQLA